jgi:hypothetical protein
MAGFINIRSDGLRSRNLSDPIGNYSLGAPYRRRPLVVECLPTPDEVHDRTQPVQGLRPQRMAAVCRDSVSDCMGEQTAPGLNIRTPSGIAIEC